jgi:hypothetical protein
MKKSTQNSTQESVADKGRLVEQSPELEVAEKLRKYADDVKLTILEYTRRGFEIHFERGRAMFNDLTNLTSTEAVLTDTTGSQRRTSRDSFSEMPRVFEDSP